ncbi:MAG: Shedu anti-phage system protein SduA domain-containing protein [Pseudonocardiaceae bacterium]
MPINITWPATYKYRTGIVKSFDEKGFGLISPDGGGSDICVGPSQTGHRILDEGERVKLAIRTDGPDGPWISRVIRETDLDKVPDDAPNEDHAVAIAVVAGRLRIISIFPDGKYRFLDDSRQLHSLLYVASLAADGCAASVEELEELINAPQVKESQLQEFFERNLHFLQGDSYEEVHPHLILKREHKGPLIPDFALKPTNLNSYCDLLDLKLPSAKLIVGNGNRRRLSATVMEACAQLREYRDYFEEERNRDAIEEVYGLKFFRPKMIVIIGKRGAYSPAELRKAESDIPHLTLITYEDLLERARSRLRKIWER